MNKIENYKKKYGKIAVMVGTKNRTTEIALLLQSLRTQTYNLFDVFILDDASNAPIMNSYFLNYLSFRMKCEGNNVTVIRNGISQGVSKMRQQLVNIVMGNQFKYHIMCRIDDDSICDKFFFEKLLDGIEAGYDLIGCIVSPVASNFIKRETKFIKPIIGECLLNDKGELVLNMDECGYEYSDEEIIPTHHFRSSCLYKREIHEAGVDYDNRLSKNGYREEQIFSFKCIIAGFKLAIHTGAICAHLCTPSGGERDTMGLTNFNQEQFEMFTKKLFEQYGDFIQDYNIKIGIGKRELDKDKFQRSENLIRNHGSI